MPATPDLVYAPALLVVADTPAAFARARAAADAAGLAIAADLPLDKAAERLADGVAPVVVWVEADAASEPLELLLRIIQVNFTRFSSVVSIPSTLIDLVAALAPDVRAHLADATHADRVDALRLALSPAPTSVRETRVAAVHGDPDATPDPVLAAQIRDLIRTRRLRARYFDPALFADPAWDMLLDLMAARLDGRRIAVSSLCIAAAVPPTTALRWTKTLTDTGLFARAADPADGRRVFVELADDAAEALRAYLADIR